MSYYDLLCILCVLREDMATCEFWVEWETRAACPVKQQGEQVEMENGTIKVPETGVLFNLGDLYYRSESDFYIFFLTVMQLNKCKLV